MLSMRDQVLIEWLREVADEQSASFSASVDPPRLREVAVRLEALSKPPEGSPLTPGRLAGIHARVKELPAEYFEVSSNAHMLCDLSAYADFLRARLDEAECWCAACCDRDGYQQGHAAGVAAALEMLRGMAFIYYGLKRWGDLPGGYQHLAVADGLHYVAGLIEEQCGPATPAPHAASLERLRRCEEAMARIAGMRGLGDGGVPEANRIAREALGENT